MHLGEPRRRDECPQRDDPVAHHHPQRLVLYLDRATGLVIGVREHTRADDDTGTVDPQHGMHAGAARGRGLLVDQLAAEAVGEPLQHRPPPGVRTRREEPTDDLGVPPRTAVRARVDVPLRNRGPVRQLDDPQQGVQRPSGRRRPLGNRRYSLACLATSLVGLARVVLVVEAQAVHVGAGRPPL
ncbi:hypothetical protein ACU686_44705 [Yinghuangia aomiensis]